jgi:hypothetical protein
MGLAEHGLQKRELCYDFSVLNSEENDVKGSVIA